MRVNRPQAGVSVEVVQIFQSISDRRIEAARDAGLFDDLPGAGQPIPDLDRRRPDGWWADNLVRRERSIQRREELDELLASAMAPLWRLGSELELRERVAELNGRIDDHNRRTSLEHRPRLSVDELVARWNRLRQDH